MQRTQTSFRSIAKGLGSKLILYEPRSIFVMNGSGASSAKSHKRVKKANKTSLKPGDDILRKDALSLLSRNVTRLGIGASEDDPRAPNSIEEKLPDRFSEVKVEILEISSNGDGLGLTENLNHVFVVPFTSPGDHVLARTVNHFPEAKYTLTDFIQVLKFGPRRDNSLVQCRYFSKCAGCQLQMLPYDDQLQHKTAVVEKAYRNFSGLMAEVVPPVGITIGSPMQYRYRTKLTPHFDGPPGSMSRKMRRDPSQRKSWNEVPPIGFQEKGRGKILDIEDCPIGTDAVLQGLQKERKRIAESFSNFTKGATILLRESTRRTPRKQESNDREQSKSTENRASNTNALEELQLKGYDEEKLCITDSKATSIEYIDDFIFKNTAGAFFQNNNSILPTFTSYIRERIIPASTPAQKSKPLKYLIDAYCGSGLFTVTLSALFKSSLGIDIAETSIVAARENATANGIENARFMTADASKLFEEVRYPPDETAIVIDPPRKGCDDAFLKQLLQFGPQRIVYVSCNVHTQARDVGTLVEGRGDCRYEIESLQGFDFFPQTGHVEGVAVLSRSAA